MKEWQELNLSDAEDKVLRVKVSFVLRFASHHSLCSLLNEATQSAPL